LSITTSRNVCRFGFMHNFAVNIWTWHRFTIAKFTESLVKQIHRVEEIRDRASSHFTSTTFPTIHYADTLDPIAIQNTTIKAGQEILGLLENFGELAIFLATCLIEYSVIGAAVMYVFWKRIDSPKKAVHKEGSRMDCRFVRIFFY
ncbi:hypothetical protein PENTCL1PPCAC_14300, partial [Pristionchus entomophagus]